MITYGPHPLPKLTSRQSEILAYIKSHICFHGFAPTVREIGSEFDIKSPNGVVCHLHALEKKDRIIRDKHSSRAIHINHCRLMFVDGLLPFQGVVRV